MSLLRGHLTPFAEYLLNALSVSVVAGLRGLEPRTTVLETVVLPLHHRPWSIREDLNPQPSAYKALALPLSYECLAGVVGIEPTSQGPKPYVLPLDDTPVVEGEGIEPS